MTRYLLSEIRIAVPWGILLLPLFLAILRLTKVVSPESPGTWVEWISFLEFIFPVLFPLFSFTVLEQEKRWRTLEVMVTTPKRKAAILSVRYLIMLFPLFLAVIAAVRPQEYLLLMAPGLALGGAGLLGGLTLGEETGLGLSLGWWGFSFASRLARPELLRTGVTSWVLLIVAQSPLSPAEILLRKWAHLGASFVFIVLAMLVAERKRTWKPR